MPIEKPSIDPDRLRGLLEGINSFGFNPETGGFNRVGYSDADMAVRDWFAGQMEADGLAVSRDPVANLFGRYGPPTGPTIMAGSHLDTVPEGGAFDGALGASVALECVRSMRDAGLKPEVAIEVVATAEEEGRFGGMLGSQTIAGVVTHEWIDQARDADGTTLIDAMAAHGLKAHEAVGAARRPGEVRAFLEIHVEQGPVLEASGQPIGIAHSVAGVRNLRVTLTGKANHSGTTPMDLRADAFAGLAIVGHAVPGIIAEHGGDNTRVTIGKVDLHPNFIHTVPGRADFVVNIRDTDPAFVEAVTGAVEQTVHDAAAANSLETRIVEQSRIAPVSLDPELRKVLHDEAAALGLDARSMPSGAGHDAQTMQSLCPSALMFVPSRDGVSHSPEEWSDWADIEKGANLMLAALIRLSGAR
ncbi:MAG: Zn-dependent hydrolase [Rhizobiaceae bacterium]|nr:Zn-dependent hydrolase [Rhizobiaceae bacterium]